MHLLVTINNNVEEWKDLQHFDRVRPRLFLPYAFGGAFLKAGHRLSAVDLCSVADKNNISPFQSLDYKHEMSSALQRVDVAALWGSDALRFILKQAMNPWGKRNILYFAYAIALKTPSGKQRLNDLANKVLGRFSKAVVVMTTEQETAASAMLGNSATVIRLRCGIDTAFYRVPFTLADIPEECKRRVEKLLTEPYVIMPGDELRFNDDAIRFVEKSGMRLVRISQYGHKSGTENLKQDVIDRNLTDRLFVFEKISYPFLRFLLQHASAYAGLVNSSWQPAGWTVACEALASGLPMVLYEGLVSREMTETGAPPKLVQSVIMGDVDSFTERLALLVTSDDREAIAGQARVFAAQHLDFEVTSPPFVVEVEKLVAEGK